MGNDHVFSNPDKESRDQILDTGRDERKKKELTDDDLFQVEVKPKEEEPKKKRATEADYTKIKTLGKGSFGRVILVAHKETSKLYVMKVMDKGNIVRKGDDCIETVKSERLLLAGIKHPFIIYLRESFSNKKKLFFILDYVNGGDLKFHIKNMGRFPEKQAQFYIAETLIALSYLHKNNILHRDLKLPNILLTREGHIRVTDFGLSYYFKSNKEDQPVQVCGSPLYVAPEIIKNLGKDYDDREPYTFSADFWSAGIMLFEMLFGYTPFERENAKKCFRAILLDNVVFPTYPKISDNCKDFILKLLEKNPKKRLGTNGIEEIKEHPFFENIDFEKLFNKEIKPPFVPKIKDALDTNQFEEVEEEEEKVTSTIDVNNSVFGSFGFSRSNEKDTILDEVDENLKKMYTEIVKEDKVKEHSLKVDLRALAKKKKEEEKKKRKRRF